MPLLHMTTSAALPDETRTELLVQLSRLVARELGKPEKYVMVTLTPRAEMIFGGSSQPACYAELKNMGTIEPARIEQLSEILCRELASGLRVAKDRIYIEFTNADGAFWGWNGSTFG